MNEWMKGISTNQYWAYVKKRTAEKDGGKMAVPSTQEPMFEVKMKRNQHYREQIQTRSFLILSLPTPVLLLNISTVKTTHHQWIVNNSRPPGEGLPIPENNWKTPSCGSSARRWAQRNWGQTTWRKDKGCLELVNNISIKNFNLNKRSFYDAVSRRYHWIPK